MAQYVIMLPRFFKEKKKHQIVDKNLHYKSLIRLSVFKLLVFHYQIKIYKLLLTLLQPSNCQPILNDFFCLIIQVIVKLFGHST